MQEHGPIVEARSDFERFVSNYPGIENISRINAGFPPVPRDLDDMPVEEQEEVYLQEYLMTWLERGNGVELTGRNYATYLRVALDIADAAMRGKIDFDYKGSEARGYKDAYRRGVVGVHQAGLTASDALDPARYDILVTQWEFRGTGKLAPGSED